MAQYTTHNAIKLLLTYFMTETEGPDIKSLIIPAVIYSSKYNYIAISNHIFCLRPSSLNLIINDIIEFVPSFGNIYKSIKFTAY